MKFCIKLKNVKNCSKPPKFYELTKFWRCTGIERNADRHIYFRYYMRTFRGLIVLRLFSHNLPQRTSSTLLITELPMKDSLSTSSQFSARPERLSHVRIIGNLFRIGDHLQNIVILLVIGKKYWIFQII